MVCQNCGAYIEENAEFCPACGEKQTTSAGTYQSTGYGQPMVQVEVNTARTQGEHVTTGGWFARILLSCVPIVGLIMLFVWAFGNTLQPSLKTWARAQLIFILIPTAIFLFYVFVFGVFVAGVSQSM